MNRCAMWQRVALLVFAIALTGSGACGTTEPARPGPPDWVVPVGGPLEHVVGYTIPVTVKVTDRNHVPIPGVVVEWVAIEGNGSVAVRHSTTSEAGEAGNQWTLGTVAGGQDLALRVTLPTGETIGGGVRATARPDNVAKIELRPLFGGVSVLAGTTLDVRSLVALATDKYGNVLQPGYAVTASPPGWVREWPGATAPAGDSEGPLTFNGVGHCCNRLQAGAVLAVSATVTVFSVPDLRTRHLRLSWACTYPADRPKTIGGVAVDSSAGAMAVDSARRAEDPGPRRGLPEYPVEWMLYASGTTTHYLRDGSMVAAPERRDFMILRQWVDSLQMQLVVSSADREWDGTAPTQAEISSVTYALWRVGRDSKVPLRFARAVQGVGVGCVEYGSRPARWALEEY